MAKEYYSTYRGQEIYIDWAKIYRYENGYWTSILDPKWYPDMTAIKAAIDEALALPIGLASFNFTRLEPVKSAYNLNETVYIKYTVKNNGVGKGKAEIVVKDRDTGETITTYSIPEMLPGYSFETTGSHANVGKMPAKNWRLEFKVAP